MLSDCKIERKKNEILFKKRKQLQITLIFSKSTKIRRKLLFFNYPTSNQQIVFFSINLSERILHLLYIIGICGNYDNAGEDSKALFFPFNKRRRADSEDDDK